jgi:porin
VSRLCRYVGLLAAGLYSAACVGGRVASTTPEPRLVGRTASAPQPDTNYIDLLDGTLSGKGDLSEDEAPKVGHVRLPSLLSGWFTAKQQFTDSVGLSFAGSYGALGQNYSTSPVDQPNAVGGKFTLNLDWALWNRGKPDALNFDIVVEDRRPLGTELPPLRAGLAAGSIVPTAATWGQFNLGVTQFYLRQSLADNRFQYAIGKVFAPNFVNPYPFFDDNRQFFNQTFSTSPTIASPLRGFGAVAAWFPFTGKGYYAQGGMYTANSDDTGLTIDDFLKTGEHFYHLDLGWSVLAHQGVPIQARGPMDAANFHVVGWFKNEQPGSPQANGVAFNASTKVGSNVLVFLRGGASVGFFTDANVSAGFGWRPPRYPSDLFGFGSGWARPSNRTLREQQTHEMFYRFHLTDNFALSPDVQLVLNPAVNPAEESIWLLGFRTRVTF